MLSPLPPSRLAHHLASPQGSSLAPAASLCRSPAPAPPTSCTATRDAPPSLTACIRATPAVPLLPHGSHVTVNAPAAAPQRSAVLADDLTLPLLLHLPPASQLTFHAAVGAPVDAAAAATATVTARLIIDATLSGSEIRGSVNLPGALLRVPSRSTSQFVPEIQRWCKMDISRLAFISRTCSPPPPLTCWHATAPRR